MTTPMPADQAAKERPILMSAPMVRAILAGTKTQTRRVVKPHKAFEEWGVKGPDDAYDAATDDDGQGFFLVAGDHGYAGPVPCPYGQPGDRLWVRESFMPAPLGNDRWNITYSADGDQVEFSDVPADYNPMLYNYERWTPSIHMPRWASRITLEVTGVRVDRLQDIMERDVFAEGIEKLEVHANTGRNGGAVPTGRFKGLDNWSDSEPYWVNPVDAFAGLWESINGAGSWAANPWVWAISFRRIDA